MPLEKGKSNAVIKRNHDKLVREGYSDDRAWAVAYDKAGKKKSKKRR